MILRAECVSTLAINQAPVITSIPFMFKDECSLARVVMPELSDQMADLFIEKTWSYPQPYTISTIDGSILNCGPITTTLLGEESNYPQLVHYPETREISVYGDDPIRHVDQFPLVLLNCITLNGQYAGCNNSTVFRVFITNPCVSSLIQNRVIPSTLAAPIEGTD